MENSISSETRRNIFDHFEMEGINWSGRLNDIDFLSRLYDLKSMPSKDSRYKDAFGDIHQHTVNNNDYEGNWVFFDERFNLLHGSDEQFFKFITEMVHPLVRPNTDEALRVVQISNDWLRESEWEIEPQKSIGGRPIFFAGRKKSSVERRVVDSDLSGGTDSFWKSGNGKLKIFISHKDSRKVDANALAKMLAEIGVSGFVAHDNIQPMMLWKREIEKALASMDGFIALLSDDYYGSVWTNQELGYALAKGVPVFLYSVDKTIPHGFHMDVQAIRAGPKELLRLLKKQFSKHPVLKEAILELFCGAINGSFLNAKERFCELVGLTLTDKEIERIVAAFSAEAKYINQLSCILSDGVSKDHRKLEALEGFEFYRDPLQEKVLNQHSAKRFRIVKEGEEFVIRNSQR